MTMCDCGYIYCVSNEAMPSILNIGITTTAPEVRLDYINKLTGNWRPPTPYKCEFAKRVCDIEKKVVAIHKILAYCRIHPEREFFRVSLEEVRNLFDLMEDEDRDNTRKNKNAEMKALEARMLECIYQKSDALDEDLTRRKAELREINETIAMRKNELDVLSHHPSRPPDNYITEY